MNTAFQWISTTTNHLRGWSWFKRFLLTIAVMAFLLSTFLYYTPPGGKIREFLAETVITTQHRDWAWIFVGSEKRDEMVRQMWSISDENALEKQDMSAIKFNKNRKIDELVSVKDISGDLWKGKMMYVYDPRTIRVVVPSKSGEGERITSMVERTNAVGAINGGGFVDPDGLGNGFAPIGPIISGGDLLYIDQDGNVPQHIVGFTKEGTLVIGKYTYPELQKLGVTEAVSFYPRVIANGKPLITSGDGGWGRGPRTAIGQRADGTVIFVVVDGRQAHSVGATLREIQDLLLNEGCINAGFLDGGASSEMVYNKQLITSPSSRYGERRLPSAFLVFDHPETLKNTRIWDGFTTIDPGGAYDNPYYQADVKAHPERYKKESTPAKKETESSSSKSESSSTSKPTAEKSGTKNGIQTSESGASKTSTETKQGSEPSPAGSESGTPTTGTGASGTGTQAGTGSSSGASTGSGANTSTSGSTGSTSQTGTSGDTNSGTKPTTGTATSGSTSGTGTKAPAPSTTGTSTTAPAPTKTETTTTTGTTVK